MPSYVDMANQIKRKAGEAQQRYRQTLDPMQYDPYGQRGLLSMLVNRYQQGGQDFGFAPAARAGTATLRDLMASRGVSSRGGGADAATERMLAQAMSADAANRRAYGIGLAGLRTPTSAQEQYAMQRNLMGYQNMLNKQNQGGGLGGLFGSVTGGLLGSVVPGLGTTLGMGAGEWLGGKIFGQGGGAVGSPAALGSRPSLQHLPAGSAGSYIGVGPGAMARQAVAGKDLNRLYRILGTLGR